jgi:hypothetical protein
LLLPEAWTRRARIGALYREVFSGPGGEQVLNDLLREAGVLSVSAVAGDPGMTHFNDGKRAIGLHIIERMRWTEPMMLELAKRQANASLANTGAE